MNQILIISGLIGDIHLVNHNKVFKTALSALHHGLIGAVHLVSNNEVFNIALSALHHDLIGDVLLVVTMKSSTSH